MSKPFKIYFSTDLHGSTTCFKKFLSAKKFYDVDYTILGGDLSGKKLILILKFSSFFRAHLGENKYLDIFSKNELNNFCNELENNGSYYEIIDPDQTIDYNEIYKIKVKERLFKWLDLAASQRENIFVIPGNDDDFYIDAIIREANSVICCDKKFIESEFFNILGYSYVTPTPWNTPREKTEDEIEQDLNSIQLNNNKKPLILNIHVPPIGIGLDTVVKLDPDFRPLYSYGGAKTTFAGSKAVKNYIEMHTPILGLFGHIHECRYVTNYKKTLCANPGSAYTEGKLLGFICKIHGNSIDSWQLTEG